MKRKILIIAGIFFTILILTLAQAGILSNLFHSVKDKISPEDKQTLKEIIGKENLPNADITYSYTADEIKWGVYIPNVMNSQDNILKRYYMNCTLYNETTNECEHKERIDYTKQELADMITTKIANKLTAYIQSSDELEFGETEVEIVSLE